MGIRGCLAVTVFVAMVLILAPCSPEDQVPAGGSAEIDAHTSAASYLRLLCQGSWPEAWHSMTDNRKSFWNELAKALAGGPAPDYPDLVLRSVRERLGVRTPPIDGYQLFQQLGQVVELDRLPLIRTESGFPSTLTTGEEQPGFSRVQIKEHGIDMRLRLIQGTWLVDSLALSDPYSDAAIESPNEEYEIFILKRTTVRLPRVETEVHRPGMFQGAKTIRVDSSAAVYFQNAFVPKAAFVDFVSSLADLKRIGEPPDNPSGICFWMELSADLKWRDVFQLLTQMFRAGCRRMIVAVKPLSDSEARGLSIQLEASHALARSQVPRREYIDSGICSATGLARVAHRVAGWLQKLPDYGLEVSISGSARWEDAVRAIAAVAENARTHLFVSVDEQGKGGSQDFSIHGIPLAGQGVPVYAEEEWLPVHVTLLKSSR